MGLEAELVELKPCAVYHDKVYTKLACFESELGQVLIGEEPGFSDDWVGEVFLIEQLQAFGSILGEDSGEMRVVSVDKDKWHNKLVVEVVENAGDDLKFIFNGLEIEMQSPTDVNPDVGDRLLLEATFYMRGDKSEMIEG